MERYFADVDEVKLTTEDPSSPLRGQEESIDNGASHFEHCPPHDISAWLNMVLFVC